MEKSKIYDMMETKFLHKWENAIKESESDSWFFLDAQKALCELESQLSQPEKQLLESLILAIGNKMEYTSYNLKVKILNFGVKIGMELQKAFCEFEDF